MKPHLIERIITTKFKLKEVLCFQALEVTLDRDVELEYIEEAVELLEELYDLLK